MEMERYVGKSPCPKSFPKKGNLQHLCLSGNVRLLKYTVEQGGYYEKNSDLYPYTRMAVNGQGP